MVRILVYQTVAVVVNVVEQFLVEALDDPRLIGQPWLDRRRCSHPALVSVLVPFPLD